MKRAITAPMKLILSATLAVSLLAAPVSAGNNNSRSNDGEFATVIGALIGLAALGAILSDKNDDRGHYTPSTPRRPIAQPNKVPTDLRLPAICFQKFRTQSGKKKYYSKRCLKRHFSYHKRIPRVCADTIVARNDRGTWVARKVYRPACLHKRGYRRTLTY